MGNENHVADLGDKKASKEYRCEICYEKADDFKEVCYMGQRRPLFACEDCFEKGIYNNDLYEIE